MGSAIYTSIHHSQIQTNTCSPSPLIFLTLFSCKGHDDAGRLVWAWPCWDYYNQEKNPQLRSGEQEHNNHNNKATGSTGVNWERPGWASITAASAANVHSQEFKGQSWPLYCTCPKKRWEVKVGRWGWATKGRSLPYEVPRSPSPDLAYHSQKAASICPYR